MVSDKNVVFASARKDGAVAVISYGNNFSCVLASCAIEISSVNKDEEVSNDAGGISSDEANDEERFSSMVDVKRISSGGADEAAKARSASNNTVQLKQLEFRK